MPHRQPIMKTDHEFAARLIDSALSRGAHLAEVYQRSSRSLSVDVKEGEIEAASSSKTFGFGLRIVRDGRPGFSFSNDPDDADTVVRSALDVSVHAAPDDALGLPEMHTPPEVNAFDPEVAAMDEGRAHEYAALIEDGAVGYDARIKKIRKASASFGSANIHIMNSKGLELEYPVTSCAANIMAVAEDGDDSQTGWGYKGGRYLKEVDFRGAGTDSGMRACRMLGAGRVQGGKFPVLLDPAVSAEFLSVFSSMLSAESVQKERSLLAGRVSEQVIHKSLTIIDNGLLANGPGRRPVDDEGTPARENILIKEGVLRGFMHNTHTANRGGAVSTGNAVRGGPSGIPYVGKLNMYFQAEGGVQTPGVLSPEEMLSDIESGLHVTDAMGVHTVNPVSGDFSIGVSGLWYSGGKPVHPVKEAVIAGNLLELFNSVIAVGDDLTFFGPVGSPSLTLGPVDLSG